MFKTVALLTFLRGFAKYDDLVVKVASVVVLPFHVMVCIKGMPCDRFFYGHIDCRPCDIFAVVHLCKCWYV
jgi:hypothetical protein